MSKCQNCYIGKGSFLDKVSLKRVCYKCMSFALSKRIRILADFKKGAHE
jgi:hypothetical protein